MFLQTNDGYFIKYNFSAPYTSQEIQAAMDITYRKLWTTVIEVEHIVENLCKSMNESNARSHMLSLQHLSRDSRVRIRDKLGFYVHHSEYRPTDVGHVKKQLRELVSEVKKLLVEATIPPTGDMPNEGRFMLPTRSATPSASLWLFMGDATCPICKQPLDKSVYILGKLISVRSGVRNSAR